MFPSWLRNFYVHQATVKRPRFLNSRRPKSSYTKWKQKESHEHQKQTSLSAFPFFCFTIIRGSKGGNSIVKLTVKMQIMAKLYPEHYWLSNISVGTKPFTLLSPSFCTCITECKYLYYCTKTSRGASCERVNTLGSFEQFTPWSTLWIKSAASLADLQL